MTIVVGFRIHVGHEFRPQVVLFLKSVNCDNSKKVQLEVEIHDLHDFKKGTTWKKSNFV